jgi:exopolysaccharide production protein ExoQ
MAPPIALFLCLVFIAWLLVRDVKRRPSSSAAIWIPTFFLLVIGSRPLSLWIGAVITGSGNAPEESWIDGTFYLLLIFGSWIVLSLRRVRWSKFFAANTTIVLFYLYFAVSVLWADDPDGSFKRWFKDFGLVFVTSVILSEKDPLEAMRAVYFRCACVLFPLSMLFIRYYGHLGRAYNMLGGTMFLGVSTQKNGLGEIVMVFSLFLIWEYLETRPVGTKPIRRRTPWDHLMLLLMGVRLLYISESKTASICLLIGLALMLRSRRLASVMINRMVLLGALCAPFLVLFVQQSSWITTPLVEALGRDPTFTGRTNIWQHITATTVNPFFGAGFYNFWGTSGGAAIRRLMHTPMLNSSHNSYLDIYLDGGFIALGLLFCLLIARGGSLIRNVHVNRYQRLRFAVLIVAIIYNITESTFARLAPIWFTTLLVLIDFPSRREILGTRENGGIVASDQVLGPNQDFSLGVNH